MHMNKRMRLLFQSFCEIFWNNSLIFNLDTLEFLRFRICYAECLDGDGLHHLVF